RWNGTLKNGSVVTGISIKSPLGRCQRYSLILRNPSLTEPKSNARSLFCSGVSLADAIVRACQRSEKTRKRSRVLQVTTPGQYFKHASRDDEPWSSKSDGTLPGRALDVFFSGRPLILDLSPRIEVQPWFVVKRVVANLVARRSDLRKRLQVFRKSRVLPNDEE